MRSGRALCVAALLAFASCAPAAMVQETKDDPRPETSVGEAIPMGAAVAFRWPDVRGGEVISTDLTGRITVLVFITTYDLPSQAQMKFLSSLGRDHVPRLNTVAVVLEPADHQPLVLAYADMLGLKFPVAMADAATIRGEGPFAGLHHVPSVAILDRDGVERFRHLGLMETAALEKAVVRVEEETRK